MLWALGAILGPLWAILDTFWNLLETILLPLEPSWSLLVHLDASRGPFGDQLGTSSTILERLKICLHYFCCMLELILQHSFPYYCLYFSVFFRGELRAGGWGAATQKKQQSRRRQCAAIGVATRTLRHLVNGDIVELLAVARRRCTSTTVDCF